MYCVTLHSAWLRSFVCSLKLFYTMLLVCCKFSEPATYFTRPWFCKFLSVLSPPNNQEQQTSVIEVLSSRGTARAPAVSYNILCHKKTTGKFLLPVFEVILLHSYFWGGQIGCRMQHVTMRQLIRAGGGGGGGRKCFAAGWPWADDSSRHRASRFGRQAAGWLGTWDTAMWLWWRQPER